MSDDEKVVFLAFKNDQLVKSGRDLMACKHCRNKAFAVVYQGEDAFPFLECTACHFHLGLIGTVKPLNTDPGAA